MSKLSISQNLIDSLKKLSDQCKSNLELHEKNVADNGNYCFNLNELIVFF